MEIGNIISLFTERAVTDYATKETSRGVDDFRLAIFVKCDSDCKEKNDTRTYDFVIKLAENDFTTQERLVAMQRVNQEYCKLGYYCPPFLTALDGTFPYVDYNEHHCIAYAEEYSLYNSAEQFEEDTLINDNGYYNFFDDAMRMNAKVAAKHFDFTDLPSAYCAFQPFSSSDETDEVMENALVWYQIAQGLPEQFAEQVKRIWNRYETNRNELAAYYDQLPTSVFQADLNYSNVLLNPQGEFVGIYDFNLCGKDVFLNYLIREVPYICFGDKSIRPQDPVLSSILYALSVVKEVYPFNELEKKAALPLWRYLKPLWWTEIQSLKNSLEDAAEIQKALDHVEELQTREINFKAAME